MIESSEVRKNLERLPEAELPAALWSRVESGRKKQVVRRRVGLGIASLALVSTLFLPMIFPLVTSRDDPLPASPLATHSPARSAEEIQADVQAVDRALQAAYDRGADDAEIAPMWVIRDALLASIKTSSPAVRHDRI